MLIRKDNPGQRLMTRRHCRAPGARTWTEQEPAARRQPRDRQTLSPSHKPRECCALSTVFIHLHTRDTPSFHLLNWYKICSKWPPQKMHPNFGGYFGVLKGASYLQVITVCNYSFPKKRTLAFCISSLCREGKFHSQIETHRKWEILKCSNPRPYRWVKSLSRQPSQAPNVCIFCGLNCSCCWSFRTFLRGQNVLIDPETQKELEEKRRRHLEHQDYIKQQVPFHHFIFRPCARYKPSGLFESPCRCCCHQTPTPTRTQFAKYHPLNNYTRATHTTDRRALIIWTLAHRSCSVLCFLQKKMFNCQKCGSWAWVVTQLVFPPGVVIVPSPDTKLWSWEELHKGDQSQFLVFSWKTYFHCTGWGKTATEERRAGKTNPGRTGGGEKAASRTRPNAETLRDRTRKAEKQRGKQTQMLRKKNAKHKDLDDINNEAAWPGEKSVQMFPIRQLEWTNIAAWHLCIAKVSGVHSLEVYPSLWAPG